MVHPNAPDDFPMGDSSPTMDSELSTAIADPESVTNSEPVPISQPPADSNAYDPRDFTSMWNNGVMYLADDMSDDVYDVTRYRSDQPLQSSDAWCLLNDNYSNTRISYVYRFDLIRIASWDPITYTTYVLIGPSRHRSHRPSAS
jgi:hypothetical protein